MGMKGFQSNDYLNNREENINATDFLGSSATQKNSILFFSRFSSVRPESLRSHFGTFSVFSRLCYGAVNRHTGDRFRMPSNGESIVGELRNKSKSSRKGIRGRSDQLLLGSAWIPPDICSGTSA